MNEFNLENEIDKLMDKLTSDLKIRITKLVLRNEKILLKQNALSQKTTTSVSKQSTNKKSSNKRETTSRRKTKEAVNTDSESD